MAVSSAETYRALRVTGGSASAALGALGESEVHEVPLTVVGLQVAKPLSFAGEVVGGFGFEGGFDYPDTGNNHTDLERPASPLG